MQRVQPHREVLQRIHRSRGQTLDEGAGRVEGHAVVFRHGDERVAGLGQTQARAVRELRDHGPVLDLDHAADAELGVVAVSEAIAESPGPTGRRHGGSRLHSSKAKG